MPILKVLLAIRVVSHGNDNPYEVQEWIYEVFERRNKIIPDNYFPPFVNNRSGGK